MIATGCLDTKIESQIQIDRELQIERYKARYIWKDRQIKAFYLDQAS